MPPTAPEPTEDNLEIGGLRVMPGDRLGPYVYRRLVGRGGMAHVLLASDPDGRPVALKVLKANRMATGLTRFKREFRALARMRHPNVIRVDAYGDIHGHPYIAMEYVEGTDLHTTIQTLRSWRAAERWRRVEEVLVDLCRALAYIHRRGLVHRDLKPSNVLIDGERRCKLTDFGIVKDLDPAADTMVSTTLVGTWAYASPEQMEGHALDHRSDLYSLGVILFAMLTGRRPFVAKDLSGYLTLHRTQAPPHARQIDPSVPAHLDEICDRLLRKNPRERFRSAQEILYRLEQQDPVTEVETRGVWRPPLVGRKDEEDRVRELVSGLTAGRGATLTLEGGEGSGRSRMLDVVEAHAMLIGLPCLRIGVEARDGSLVPLVRLARLVVEELGEREVPRTLHAALEAFGAEGEPVQGNARERLADGLHEGLAALLEDAPLVVLVDDLHRARVPMLDTLAGLVRRLAGMPVLFGMALATDRMTPRLDAIRTGHLLHETPARVLLQPLPLAAIEELAVGLLGAGRPASALATRLHRETQGNPLFVTLFLQHLMGQGILVRARPVGEGGGRPGAWKLAVDVEEIQSGHLELPPGVRQVVRARLAPLTGRERDLACTLAVHGPKMELDLLLEVLGLDEDDAQDRIEKLEDAGIVILGRVGEVEHLSFTHAKYGDVLYRELSLDNRAELHRRIARALEAQPVHGAARAEVVGEHWRRAGEAGKAWQHMVAAAERLRDRSLPGEAREIAERAQGLEEAARVDLDDETWATTRQRLMQVMAEIAISGGGWSEARDYAEQAIAMGPTEGEDAPTVRARLTLSRVLRATGESAAAEAEACESLAIARTLDDVEIVPEALRVRAVVAWSRGDVETTEIAVREALALAATPGMAQMRAHLLLTRGAVQQARGQLGPAAASFADAERLLRDLHLKHWQASAVASRAAVVLQQGLVSAALEDANTALLMALETGHAYGETLARVVRGSAWLALGAVEQAAPELEVALKRARTLRQPLDLAVPAVQLARARLALGQPAAAARFCDEASAAVAGGDPELIAPVISGLRTAVAASNGDTARVQAALERGPELVRGLPDLRRAQVELLLADAASRVGLVEAASGSARQAAQLAAHASGRLVLLEAWTLLAGVAPEPGERDAATGHRDALVRELLPLVPEALRMSFERRVTHDGA